MARKKNADLEKTKQCLLETGLELFARQGFNATGIQEITNVAGVPKGSFYNYFSSKEEFGVAIITYYSEKYKQRWCNLLQEGDNDPFLALKHIYEQMIICYEAAEQKPGCLVGKLAAEISEASEECRAAMQEAVQSWKGLMAVQLAAGQEKGIIRSDLTAGELADLFWDLWEGSLLRMKIEKTIDPVKNAVRIFFDYVLKP